MISRRGFVGAGFVGMCSLFARRCFGDSSQVVAVKTITPPRWLSRAHDIVRAIRKPVIPPKAVRLAPCDGDTRRLIQDTIDELGAKGGGQVVLTPGVWRVEGPLVMRSRIELHLEKGAQLSFVGDRALYLPAVRTRWEGTDLYGYSPCVYAYKVSDVAITGQGTLEMMQGGDIESWRLDQTEAQKRLRLMGASGVPLEQRIFAPQGFLRPSFIQFFESERILVEGITVGSIPFWGVHLVYSRDITVRSVTMASDKVNNDGVDIDSSRSVLIEACTFRTGDDCIAIKSGRDLDGRVVAQPARDIVIRDCNMQYGGSAGLAIGSEMSGGVNGVYIFRCTMKKVQTALNIKSNLDRGGYVEHVRAWNISIQACERLVQITTAYHGYAGGAYPPRFEDITVEDLRCEVAREAISLQGVPSSPVKRIYFKDVQVSSSKQPLKVSHVEGLRCDDVRINGYPLSCNVEESVPVSRL